MDMGTLTVVGPRRLSDEATHRTCIAGQQCDLADLQGNGFSASDRLLLLDQRWLQLDERSLLGLLRWWRWHAALHHTGDKSSDL